MVATVWILSALLLVCAVSCLAAFRYLAVGLSAMEDGLEALSSANKRLSTETAECLHRAGALEERLAKLEKPAEQPVPKQPVISKRWTESRDQLEGKPARKALRVEKAS